MNLHIFVGSYMCTLAAGLSATQYELRYKVSCPNFVLLNLYQNTNSVEVCHNKLTQYISKLKI